MSGQGFWARVSAALGCEIISAIEEEATVRLHTGLRDDYEACLDER